ncbi:hypothetical protein Tco_0648335 [Tanacetum coccineum]
MAASLLSLPRQKNRIWEVCRFNALNEKNCWNPFLKKIRLEEPEEEPEPNNGHEDQFAQHPNPQPGNMNSWLEEYDDMNENVNDEDIEDQDVEIEVDDEAELIFPYEVEGDQTPPPRDESSDFEPPNAESSDSVSSDSESEDEEADIAPGPTVGTATQRPFAIRDFPRGIYEVGESSSAHDSSYIGGLEPCSTPLLPFRCDQIFGGCYTWALRRDLEATRTRARLIEAEVGTNRTETTLLDSKIKIEVKILESGENATLKKKLEDKEMQLVIARMDCANAERRLHESIGWNRRFYWEMVLKGAVPKLPSDDEDDGRSRKKSKNSDRDDGPSEPRGPPSDS